MKVEILILSLVLGVVLSVCPNNCNNNGRCVGSSCECFESAGIGDGKSYTGNDCSMLRCPEGNPFSFSDSTYPSSSGDSGIFLRELYESNSRMLTESKMVIGEGEEAIDDAGSSVWRVNATDDFFKPLPKMGGRIHCNYTVTGGTESTLHEVEVLGVSDDKKMAYLKFEKGIDKSKEITCDRIMSIRKSMVYYGDGKVANSAITWDNYYGIIFKELGILTEQPTDPVNPGQRERRNLEDPPAAKEYSNDKFKFACYSSSNVLTEYTAKVSYTPTKTLTIELTGTPAPTPAYCYCLMDSNATATTIDKTELSEIVNNNKIGKFFGSDGEEIDENGNAVIITSASVVVASNAATDVAITSSSEFIVDNRVVYVDILKDGIISEKKGTISAVTPPPPTMRKLAETTFTITFTEVTGIMLPYIKMHSSNPTTDTTPNKDDTALDTNLYKVYSLADVMISQLNQNVGGKLQCSYINSNSKTIDILVDVKGYKKSTPLNHIIYSYIQFPDDVSVSNIATMKCSKIYSKRKDFTFYNPLKLTNNGGNYVPGADSDGGILTWTGYGNILKGVKDGSKVNFACYTPTADENGEEIKKYESVTVANPGTAGSTDVKFTFDTASKPAENDICYLAAKIDGTAIDELLDSDLGSYIRKDEKGIYYYGKYAKPAKNEIKVEQDDNGNPVFVLEKSKIDVSSDASTITIVVDELTSDDLEYFQEGKTIYIEVIGSNAIPYIHEGKLVKKQRQRLLVDVETKTFTIIPAIPENDKPTGVIYTAPLNKVITISPIDTSNKLYNITGFFNELVSKLPKQFGGKLQCKYVETKTGKGIMGIVDVKGYKVSSESIDYGYFQFDRDVKSKEGDKSEYKIEDIVCNEIISERKDMSLLNPITADGSYTITWTGYAEILKDNGLSITGEEGLKTIEQPVIFTCYNPSDPNKIMKEYKTLTVEVESGNVKFTFGDNKPSNGDICYLLVGSDGKYIDIESSELSGSVRKGDDGEYYYGEFIDVEDNTEEIIKNDDGSITVVLGKDKISEDEDDGSTNDGMVNIGKLSDVESPSLSYPPSLITDGIKKLMVAGTKMTFKQNDNTQTTQILKVKAKENGKFEISLNKGVGRRLRSLSNNRLLASSPLTITFENEGSVHKSLECSGQGECDRTSGICKCYDGFSGSACQRLDCPNNCNGNGRCVSLSELLSNSEIVNNYEGFGNKHESKEGKVEFDDQIFGCLCDKRHRGYDCSLIECPSDEDPEKATNTAGGEYRDCSGRGICNYNTGVCECFDGFSGEGCQTMAQMM